MSIEKTDRALRIVVALAGLMFLALLSRRVEPGSAVAESSGPYLDRFETVVIRAPARLIRFARENPGIPSYDELVRRLERAGLRGAWFAYTDRVHLRDREPGTRTVLLRAGRDPLNFAETIDVLASLAGSPPRRPLQDFANARVAVIPEDLLGMEPRNALGEIEEQEQRGLAPAETPDRFADDALGRLPISPMP